MKSEPEEILKEKMKWAKVGKLHCVTGRLSPFPAKQRSCVFILIEINHYFSHYVSCIKTFNWCRNQLKQESGAALQGTNLEENRDYPGSPSQHPSLPLLPFPSSGNAVRGAEIKDREERFDFAPKTGIRVKDISTCKRSSAKLIWHSFWSRSFFPILFPMEAACRQLLLAPQNWSPCSFKHVSTGIARSFWKWPFGRTLLQCRHDAEPFYTFGFRLPLTELAFHPPAEIWDLITSGTWRGNIVTAFISGEIQQRETESGDWVWKQKGRRKVDLCLGKSLKAFFQNCLLCLSSSVSLLSTLALG